MRKRENNFLTDAQLKSEILKCEYCEEKPCKEACPVDCSPADFIMAASVGEKSDYKRSAALILGNNPLGGVCGCVCPEVHCMKACVHNSFGTPVNIPAVQATIIQKAKELGVIPEFDRKESNGKKIALIGTGPSSLGAASVLAQMGYKVVLFEKEEKFGGMCNLIPDNRLNKEVLKSDFEFFKTLGDIEIRYKEEVKEPKSLLSQGFDSVIVGTGLDKPLKLGIPGEEKAYTWLDYLKNHKNIDVKNKKVAIIGGGAIAIDCATEAIKEGVEKVEMFSLEKFSEMPLFSEERKHILDYGIEITGRVRVTEIKYEGENIKGIQTLKVKLPKGMKFHPKNMVDDNDSTPLFRPFDVVIIAIGSRSSLSVQQEKGIFYTGDMVNGPKTVVEAIASGKNTALIVDAYLNNKEKPVIEKSVKSTVILQGRKLYPVSLETDFFGRKIISPFILSAAPPTDGYEQMKKAYKAGWAGGIMKTSFDNVPIHIPGEYMFALTQSTYGNCDNVSGHPLDRVCEEVKRLAKEFPDRLTMASTGGPVSGNDEDDKKAWQSNTKKLEDAGAMGIEYSLSCPQGGDGTKGDIVSQDPELTAKIVDWVMEISDPEIPKLFKLTAAVTSLYPIITAIKKVFSKYPNKKAGITLANTFPSMAFRKGNKKEWEEGIVIGMSGEGVTQISNLSLANASKLGVHISGNGGPMNYKAAANFLALGVNTVQFCTIVMKYGYGIIEELNSGLSYLMAERGYKSVKDLIGCALPNPITGFMELTSKKKISAVDRELCEHCGNCTRCSYMAIKLDSEKIPVTDPSLCIGCSICVQKCFSGALYMRERTDEELKLLKEN